MYIKFTHIFTIFIILFLFKKAPFVLLKIKQTSIKLNAGDMNNEKLYRIATNTSFSWCFFQYMWSKSSFSLYRQMLESLRRVFVDNIRSHHRLTVGKNCYLPVHVPCHRCLRTDPHPSSRNTFIIFVSVKLSLYSW